MKVGGSEGQHNLDHLVVQPEGKGLQGTLSQGEEGEREIQTDRNKDSETLCIKNSYKMTHFKSHYCYPII